MKILIFTQKVDLGDSVLGFFHGWIAEFAREAAQVTVICLYLGEHRLPSNVKVLSLGKERGKGRLAYVVNFYRYIWTERGNYDAVFVHMNQIYVLLGGLLWRAWGKRIALWYTHKSVTLSLRAALVLAHTVFAPSREGFPLETKKLFTTGGQGIDTDLFSPAAGEARERDVRIVTVGRISPVKDYETLVRAMKKVAAARSDFTVTVIGAPGVGDERYFERIKAMVKESGLERQFVFAGPMRNTEIVKHLQKSDLFLSMGGTGGMDKAVVEPMAVGLPVLTSNEVFVPILGPHGLMYGKGDADELAAKTLALIRDPARRHSLAVELRAIAVRDHSLSRLIKKILGVMMGRLSSL